MKRAIVIGATGSMGFALVKELVDRNIRTVAFARSEKKLSDYKSEWGTLADVFRGDAMKKQDLQQAISKADVVFHTLNIPYQDWDPALFTILENILAECAKQKKPLVYVDNIYSYGLQDALVNENSTKHPHTKKGNIRLKLQKQIENSGVPYLIAHFPDFYGPKAGSTLLQTTFQQVLKKKNTAMFIGKTNIKREFIYVKDGAKALVELAHRKDAYGETWNIPGAGTITGLEIQKIVSNYYNRNIKFSTIQRWMIKGIALFNPFMREFVEMMYLNETPVILDGTKYESRIGTIPRTPYEVAIRETLEEMSQKEMTRV